MTPEAQRIAIAEACGWTATKNLGSFGGFVAKTPGGLNLWDDHLGATARDAIEANCPDYLNDLNAMHEAEKVLIGTNIDIYVANLGGCIDEPTAEDEFCVLHATAAQRAEAFLRTLGKWEESTKETTK